MTLFPISDIRVRQVLGRGIRLAADRTPIPDSRMGNRCLRHSALRSHLPGRLAAQGGVAMRHPRRMAPPTQRPPAADANSRCQRLASRDDGAPSRRSTMRAVHSGQAVPGCRRDARNWSGNAGWGQPDAIPHRCGSLRRSGFAEAKTRHGQHCDVAVCWSHRCMRHVQACQRVADPVPGRDQHGHGLRHAGLLQGGCGQHAGGDYCFRDEGVG